MERMQRIKKRHLTIWTIELERASAETLGIYDALKAAGAKLMPHADTGKVFGERGDPDYVGWLDRALKKKAEE
jgi:hypothetical protein